MHAATSPAAPTRGNLPVALTSFVGREPELAEVRRLMGEARLVTLTGAGGCGKTRLALAAAEPLAAAHPDGAWFADLAPLADAALVPQAILAALGAREAAERTPLAGLTDYLRARRLLLVLDNCEHLVTACADVAAALLRACPGVQVLATSREPLGVPGEAPYRVPSLPVPDPHPPPPLAAVADVAAVRLFVERARLLQPAFAVTEANAALLAQICRRLDGLPLAIELAAARVRVLSLAQICRRLDDRFHLLTGGARTALPRQRTLRAAIDWSYDLLTEPERVLLRRLAVFAGGWTLEAAEAVCAGAGIAAGDVLDLLTGLVDRSLAQAEAGGVEARYRLLETIRQYAEEKLDESGEAAAVRGRHLAWCLALAEAGERELTGLGQAAWSRRLLAEHDNLRAALAWARTADVDAAAGVRLAGALSYFWRHYGFKREGRAWLLGALARRDGVADRPVAYALAHAAEFARAAGDRPAAAALAAEAVAVARAAGEGLALAIALRHLAYVTADPAARRARYEESLAAARRAGDGHSAAMALLFLGRTEEALATARAAGDADGASLALMRLGLRAHEAGDRARARALLEEGLAQARALGMPFRVAMATGWLGQVTADAGQRAEARQLLREALPLMQRMGETSAMTIYLEELARLDAAEGRPLRAARLLGAVAAQPPPEPEWPRGRPMLDPRTDPDVVATRQTLGAQRFAAAWAAGRALALAEAIAEALAEDATDAPAIGAGAGSPAANPLAPLSAREAEVAGLVRHGLTNRQIAARLSISERTVERHVGGIFAKLGLVARAQVAAWVAERRGPAGDATGP